MRDCLRQATNTRRYVIIVENRRRARSAPGGGRTRDHDRSGGPTCPPRNRQSRGSPGDKQGRCAPKWAAISIVRGGHDGHLFQLMPAPKQPAAPKASYGSPKIVAAGPRARLSVREKAIKGKSEALAALSPTRMSDRWPSALLTGKKAGTMARRYKARRYGRRFWVRWPAAPVDAWLHPMGRVPRPRPQIHLFCCPTGALRPGNSENAFALQPAGQVAAGPRAGSQVEVLAPFNVVITIRS